MCDIERRVIGRLRDYVLSMPSISILSISRHWRMRVELFILLAKWYGFFCSGFFKGASC